MLVRECSTVVKLVVLDLEVISTRAYKWGCYKVDETWWPKPPQNCDDIATLASNGEEVTQYLFVCVLNKVRKREKRRDGERSVHEWRFQQTKEKLLCLHSCTASSLALPPFFLSTQILSPLKCVFSLFDSACYRIKNAPHLFFKKRVNDLILYTSPPN